MSQKVGQMAGKAAHDLQKIHALIARTRRRLRVQVALEWATTASILAIAGALAVLWLWRMEYLTDAGALGAGAGLAGAIVLAGLAGAARRFPTPLVASRLDRASGLSDRLGTACEFADRLGHADPHRHPDTEAMMAAAVADGVRAVPRARVKAATPFRAPRDLRPALAFLVVAGAVALLAFSPPGGGFSLGAFALQDGRDRADDGPGAEERALAAEDLLYPRELLEDMRKVAEETQDPHLEEFAKKLEELLEKAERGEISKEQLLAEMDALEQEYMKGAEQNAEDMLKDLKDSGKELKKEEVTERLGEALESGDMDAAKKELERLAEQLEKGEMKPQDQKKLAEALEKMEKKRDEKQRKDDQQAQKQIDKKKDEIRKLEKKLEKQPKDEQAKRELDKKKRELDKLERDRKDKQEQAQKRQLERLHRDMKKTAESLRNQNQKQAAQNMKNSAEDAQGVQDEVRKVENQKKAQSQLADLKDALRRAKPGQKGQKGNQGRAQRLADFQRRAGGQQGNGQAWKPGQGQKGSAMGKGQGQKGQGQDNPNGQPGDGIGDSHDPNLQGDATDRYGKTREQELEGKHGKGPSRRETILTSAKKGFAGASYRRVFADYKKIVEEVMNAEKVPQGYKYYVKQYFQKIKPHSME